MVKKWSLSFFFTSDFAIIFGLIGNIFVLIIREASASFINNRGQFLGKNT